MWQDKDRDRRLLAKPIKYFHEMQELFSDSNANGSLAIDQQTCCDIDSKSDSNDHEGLNDVSTYAILLTLLKKTLTHYHHLLVLIIAFLEHLELVKRDQEG
uniref:Uncharacterized protein n=1 Tax=Oryza meridionalis TaxID=40149 RepID=A0A0E0F4C4_9ORYZ